MEQELGTPAATDTAKKKRSLFKAKEKGEKAPRKKLKKRYIVLGIMLIAIALGVFMFTRAAKKVAGNLLAFDETSLIEHMELTYSISATGTVISANSKNIYSTQAYTVEEVFVKVGDFVNEGDPLCKLDSKALEDQIEKKQMAMGLSAEAAAQQVKTARDAYNANRSAINEGLNASLISAQSQVQSAQTNLEKAQKAYDEYLTTLNLGQNSQILTLETNVNAARTNMDNAWTAMNDAKTAWETAKNATPADITALQTAANTAKVAYDDAVIKLELARAALNSADPIDDTAYKTAQAAFTTASSNLATAEDTYNKAQQALMAAQSASANIDALKKAYDQATTGYNTARDNYDSLSRQLDAAYRGAGSQLDDYAKTVETAYANYQTALEQLAATEKSVQTQLQQSKNSLSSTQISANDDISMLELTQMHEELEKTTVTATKTGTVTAVYAKVGNSGSGLLFVIEDVDNLKIDTTVKEYDMGTVKVGQSVTIKSDATGDEIIDGVIDNISPASRKTATGAIDLTGDVVFPAEVVVKTKGTGLKIGMSARLNYIIDQKKDAMAVPYESIYTNDAGQTCVITVTDQGDGTHLIGELPVTVGMETDLYIEVSGEGVQQGIRVVNTAENIIPLIGMKIPVAEKRVSTASNGPFMMMGG